MECRRLSILAVAMAACVTPACGRPGPGPEAGGVAQSTATTATLDNALVESVTSTSAPPVTVPPATLTPVTVPPSVTSTTLSAPEAIGSGVRTGTLTSSGAYTVKPDGTLWAWGRTVYGLTGPFTGTETLPLHGPVRVGSDADWRSVWAGGRLALKADGTMWQVGMPYFPEAVVEHVVGSTPMSIAPIQLGHDRWVSVADTNTGEGDFLAVREDGTLWHSGLATAVPTFVQFGTATDWAAVASTRTAHCLALKTDGSLWAWGSNFAGQLGDGTTDDHSEPVRIGTGTDWVSIATGYTYSAAIKADGSLWTWGQNTSGQLGDGTTTNRARPVRVGREAKWASVSAAMGHTAALTTSGEFWEWGAVPIEGDPVAVRLSPGRTGTDRWTSLADRIEANGVVAVRQDGTLWAWGSNPFGALLDGTGGGPNHVSPLHQIGPDSDWGP